MNTDPAEVTADKAPHWVELRIHGVSGTPPEAMLGSAHAKQVAGDSWGRFFRPVDSVGQEIKTPGKILEGYHWGHFTSGSWKQGLWLLLIPFGFINAAAFMLPDPGKKPGQPAPGTKPQKSGRLRRALHTTAAGLIRSIGFGLTCTFALTAALILVHLMAWQWAPTLAWLAVFPDGVVLAAALVLAGLVVFGLFLMGNQNRGNLSFPPAQGCLAADHPESGLSRAQFYSGNPDSPTLGRLHLSAGWAVVALIGAATGKAVSESTWATLLLLAAIALIGVVATVTLLLGDPEGSMLGSKTRRRWHRLAHQISWVGVLAGGAEVVAAAVLLLGADHRPASLDFDSYSRWLSATMAGAMVIQLVVMIMLSVSTRAASHEIPKDFRRYGWGLAAWGATATGIFLGVGFCGAFLLGIAKALGVRTHTALVYRVAYAWGLTVLLLLALAVLGLLSVMARLRVNISETKATYARLSTTPTSHPSLPAGWFGRIGLAVGIARVKNLIHILFLSCAGFGLLMTIIAALEMFEVDVPGVVSNLSGVPSDGTFERVVINVGTYTLIALAGLLLLLGRRALSAEQTRRGVNVVWDVVSFWPHSAHPFVPAAYSQFAVRDLRRRISYHLGLLQDEEARTPILPPKTASAVVLSAHSQGSLIAFATMLWLERGADREVVDRVGLLTYGSQLQVAFPRAFPAYVSFGLVKDVFEALEDPGPSDAHRWINLYRETDPIAGPVLSWKRSAMRGGGTPTSMSLGSQNEADDMIDRTTGRRESGNDWRVLDPTPADKLLQRRPVVKLERHSAFPESIDFPHAISRVRPDLVRTSGQAGTADGAEDAQGGDLVGAGADD